MELEQDKSLEENKLEGAVHMRVDEDPAPEDDIEQDAHERNEDEEPEVILDLFGEPIEPIKPVKLPPAKANNASAPKPKPKPSPPKPEEKFGPEYQYAYAGHVGNLPEEDMTLDRVREYLQVDFPELSKERTKMDVDKEKQLIVPLVLGAKKG